MTTLDEVMLDLGAKIIDAMEAINRSSAKIALVTDSDRRLLGVVTDGDIRRGILHGIDLNEPVMRILNTSPHVVSTAETETAMLAAMKHHAIHHLPVVDSERRVLRLVTWEELARPAGREAWVVIMAGGLGQRLHPLTETTPKPLLPVGGRPLLEITLDNLARQGFEQFYLSVNYRAEMIEDHFGDGSRFGITIHYLNETERLGTAGALRLLRKDKPKVPLIVINGDILTTVDGRLLLMFHQQHRGPATVCVREHNYRVPYGVVMLNKQGGYDHIDEKPLRQEIISAGINVLSPEALDLLPDQGPVDMPDLLRNVAVKIGAPAIYPLQEYWLDIGHLDDLNRAQSDVLGLFD